MSEKANNIEKIKKDGVHSVYQQVAQCLRNELSLGQLADAQGRLPSYRRLAQDFGVSVCAIQNAMRLLRNESLITTCHGKAGKISPHSANLYSRSMFRLGMIHPFTSRQIADPNYLQKAMEKLNYEAMISVQLSNNDPQQERQIAEKFIYNNFDAILLSPEDSFANEDYFAGISKKIPVMLIDQAFPNAKLPGVIVDYAKGGQSIGEELRARKCRRVLAILDEHLNSSVCDMVSGIETHLPVRRFVFPLFKNEMKRMYYDFNEWECIVGDFRKILEAVPDIDCIFSPYDAIIQQLYIDEIPDPMRRNKYIATVREELNFLHSQKFMKSNLLEWRFDRCNDLVFNAVKRLLQWRQTRIRPTGIKRIQMHLDVKCPKITLP